jgi:NifU-like protein involved in Fe-S cluster formation
MDEAIVKYYKGLLKTGFNYAGSIDNPSILLDSVNENINLCGQAAGNSLHLYVTINNALIDDIKYLCTCDPTVNVVIEILCGLVKGKTLAEVKNINEEYFSRALGCQDEEFLQKARQALEFLNRGINRFGANAA